jgi:hypothetical protein
MLPSLLILDNFISDPVAARNAALALDYDPQTSMAIILAISRRNRWISRV